MAVIDLEKSVVLGDASDQLLERVSLSSGGLSSDEAARRLEMMGPNVIARDDKISIVELILDQIRNPLIYVLLVAAVITTIVHEYSDTAVILAVVLLNGIIGFTQEYKANTAMQALRGLTSPTARVRRDGRVTEIPSADLVPGDIVVMEAGDRVDADCRILSCRELRLDESMLTGESMPVEKVCGGMVDTEATMADWVNMVFAGTLVTEGRGEALVVSTASDMELGRIAEQVQGESRVETPLQHSMKKFSHLVALATLVLSGVVVVIGVAHGLAFLEISLAAIALAVAAIPEGLPVVVTITLAIGVRNMAKRKALIRKLPAVETLGSTEVICSDKTGTLTQNRMTASTMYFGPWKMERSEDSPLSHAVLEVWDGAASDAHIHPAHQAKSHLARVAALCNNSTISMENDEVVERLGSPTELALLEMAITLHPELYHKVSSRNSLAEIPFSSDRKFMASVFSRNGRPELGAELLVKGSPESVIAKCDKEIHIDGSVSIDADKWLNLAQELAGRGQRVLALASRDWEHSDDLKTDMVHGLTLIGLVGLIDPPRQDAAKAVRDAQGSGINIVMITGDHAATARAIAIEMNILKDEGALCPVDEDPRVVTGRQLVHMSDEELIERLYDVKVYARVTPQDKHRLVRLFREQGKVVAVTGDGVNDAPALKTAHLGVAMGKSGTEVARQASDMVLLDDSFATIYNAVKEGRYVFQNIKKVSFFLISSGVGQVAAVMSALAFGWPVPYAAVQILWTNLVSNGLQDVALAFEPGEEHLAKKKPRGLKEGMFDRLVLQHTVVITILFAAGTLIMFNWTGFEQNLREARTVAMTTIVMFQMWHVFNCRSLDRSIRHIPLGSNKFLLFSVIAAFCAQLTVIYWPPLQSVFQTTALSLNQWLAIGGMTSSVIVVIEISKWFGRRRAEDEVK